MTRAASPTRLLWTRFMRHQLALLSLVFLVVLLLLSLAAPLIAELRGVDPTATDLFAPLRAAVGGTLAGHRRPGPRPLPAPARRRPRVVAGRPLGRPAVGHPGRPDRRRGGLPGRPPRQLPDALHRWRHCPAAAAA